MSHKKGTKKAPPAASPPRTNSKPAANKAPGGSPPPPRSRFDQNRYTSPISKSRRDTRHTVTVLGLKGGVVVAYLTKANKNEEPYSYYDMDLLQGNPDLMVTLNINALVYRKGPDGDTPMKQNPNSEYNWRQMVNVIGEEQNTPLNRLQYANAMIAHFNANATIEHYRFPKRIRFGGDLTAAPMNSVDEALLDVDILGLIRSAYPDHRFTVLATFDTIVSTFWHDLDYGRRVLENAHDDLPEVPEEVPEEA